ncbi:MAG: CD1247 N-terminal domain-containing protein [Bacillota bacterium]
MDELKKRVSYLQGLAEGLQVAENSTEGRVIQGVIDVLQAMVEEVETVKDEQESFGEYLEAVDEDLSNLEDDYYFEAAEDEFVEAVCPNCGETVLFEQALAEEDDMEVQVTCPNCGQIVYSNDQGELEITSGDEELTDDDLEEWAALEPQE